MRCCCDRGSSPINCGTPLAMTPAMHVYPRGASSKFHRRPPERRHARRSAYEAHVRVETDIARGMDISPLGLAVEMAYHGKIGDVVRVALSPRSEDGAVAEIGASARVVRVDQTPRGAVVALLFVDSDSD